MRRLGEQLGRLIVAAQADIEVGEFRFADDQPVGRVAVGIGRVAGPFDAMFKIFLGLGCPFADRRLGGRAPVGSLRAGCLRSVRRGAIWAAIQYSRAPIWASAY